MKATKEFLESYGSRGAQFIVRRIVQDWLDLDVNAELVKAGDPTTMAAREVLDRMLPMLGAMLDEQANQF